jgi:hypothetical protein
MLVFHELEDVSLYAGLGIQLIDDFESVPAQGLEVAPIGWTRIELAIDDGGGVFRAIEPPYQVIRGSGGVLWFPYLERYRDARGRAPRTYRVRIEAEFYVPSYSYQAEGVDIQVAPYDPVNPPAFVPTLPTKIHLLPAAMYPFEDAVPVLHGSVVDTANAPVVAALVTWMDGALQTDAVLTDADGEFSLPMRRAPRDTPIDIHAERPPPPAGGRAGDTIVRIPQDLSILHTIQIS